MTVGLSADVVFGVLDASTRTKVLAPQPPTCPPLNCCSDGGAPFLAADGSAGGDGTVVITKEQVVGPYATVQLSASDPQALNTWLTQNGFAIPTDIQPIVAAYVAEKFDFLAMKLLPGKGVSSMRPVRVTTPGASAALPLRMVGAGTGAVVGITLWVLGEGRYEPTNFPTFEITGPELTWDFAAQRSNYAELRAAKTAASAGKGWERESSLPASVSGLKNAVLGSSFVLPDGGLGSDYTPDGPKTAIEVRDEDLETLYHGIAPADLRHHAPPCGSRARRARRGSRPRRHERPIRAGEHPHARCDDQPARVSHDVRTAERRMPGRRRERRRHCERERRWLRGRSARRWRPRRHGIGGVARAHRDRAKHSPPHRPRVRLAYSPYARSFLCSPSRVMPSDFAAAVLLLACSRNASIKSHRSS